MLKHIDKDIKITKVKPINGSNNMEWLRLLESWWNPKMIAKICVWNSRTKNSS